MRITSESKPPRMKKKKAVPRMRRPIVSFWTAANRPRQPGGSAQICSNSCAVASGAVAALGNCFSLCGKSDDVGFIYSQPLWSQGSRLGLRAEPDGKFFWRHCHHSKRHPRMPAATKLRAPAWIFAWLISLQDEYMRPTRNKIEFAVQLWSPKTMNNVRRCEPHFNGPPKGDAT